MVQEDIKMESMDWIHVGLWTMLTVGPLHSHTESQANVASVAVRWRGEITTAWPRRGTLAIEEARRLGEKA